MKDIELLFLILIYRIELDEYCIIMFLFQYGYYYSLIFNLTSMFFSNSFIFFLLLLGLYNIYFKS